MQKPLKAALLSALVFPGLGHYFLKRYVAAAILASAAFGGLYFLIAKTTEMAFQISGKIQSGDIPLDVATISELVSEQTTGAEAQLPNTATAVLLVAWVISIVDSYRVAKGP